MPPPPIVIDPLMSADEAAAMVRLCERYGSYATYGSGSSAEEQQAAVFGEGVLQRHDVAMQFVRTGGRFGRQEAAQVLAARTNYFRETYAYETPVVEGIEPFLRHQGFVSAARHIHGRPVVAPAIVYANLLVPGQELAVHTDVPEFRGANRTCFPQWLLVVMLHSGLFEAYRRPIATGIAYFNECTGGALVFYPDGADGAAETLPARHNTAVVLDTDMTFHGVDRVGPPGALPPLGAGCRLQFAGDDTWCVVDGDSTLARYRWDEIRYSVSWKAYCYEDERDRRRCEEHEDDLTLPVVIDRLAADLEERGRLPEGRSDDTHLALTMIDEYIRFPAPAAQNGA